LITSLTEEDTSHIFLAAMHYLLATIWMGFSCRFLACYAFAYLLYNLGGALVREMMGRGGRQGRSGQEAKMVYTILVRQMI
jgi:hypothetical protein